MNECTDQITAWITEQTKQKIDENTQLISDGVLDSMLILIMVGWLEQTFSVTVGVEQMTPDFFSTASNIAEQITKLQAA